MLKHYIFSKKSLKLKNIVNIKNISSTDKNKINLM